MHENIFSYVTLNEDTIVHNKKLTIVIVYRQVIKKTIVNIKVVNFKGANKLSNLIVHIRYLLWLHIAHTNIVNQKLQYNQNDAQKSGQLRYIKKLSIALVQTKVINCNFANKVVSCNLCTRKLSQLRRNLAIFSDFVGRFLYAFPRLISFHTP